MNLHDWAAVGEIVSGVGVILSLIYLARQIGQSTRQIEEQARAQRLSRIDAVETSLAKLRDFLMRDSAVAELWLRTLREYSELTEVEQIRGRAMLQEYFFMWSNEFDRRPALRENQDLEDMRHNMAAAGGSSGCRDWWGPGRGCYRKNVQGLSMKLQATRRQSTPNRLLKKSSPGLFHPSRAAPTRLARASHGYHPGIARVQRCISRSVFEPAVHCRHNRLLFQRPLMEHVVFHVRQRWPQASRVAANRSMCRDTLPDTFYLVVPLRRKGFAANVLPCFALRGRQR
jgi:hypothetical protein